MALKDLLTKHRLPQHGAKYEQLRITSWWQLEDIFNRCANFDAMARPSTAEMLCLINRRAWLTISVVFLCQLARVRFGAV